jgi:4'-phosphopantetheinyl transferase EntD
MGCGQSTRIAPIPEGLLPSRAVGVVSFGAGDPAVLYPSEAVAVARSASKRGREFAAGRAAARIALERLGEAPVAIPVGADRAPQWPEGVVGSISHSDGCSLAAVARARDFRGLGVDVEPWTPLASRLLSKILTDTEAAHLRSLGGHELLGWAKIAFSAKESLYKCYQPLARSFLGFHDVDLHILAADGHLRIRLTRDDRPSACGARTFEGCYVVHDGYVFTAVALPCGGDQARASHAPCSEI